MFDDPVDNPEEIRVAHFAAVCGFRGLYQNIVAVQIVCHAVHEEGHTAGGNVPEVDNAVFPAQQFFQQGGVQTVVGGRTGTDHQILRFLQTVYQQLFPLPAEGCVFMVGECGIPDSTHPQMLPGRTIREGGIGNLLDGIEEIQRLHLPAAFKCVVFHHFHRFRNHHGGEILVLHSTGSNAVDHFCAYPFRNDQHIIVPAVPGDGHALAVIRIGEVFHVGIFRPDAVQGGHCPGRREFTAAGDGLSGSVRLGVVFQQDISFSDKNILIRQCVGTGIHCRGNLVVIGVGVIAADRTAVGLVLDHMGGLVPLNPPSAIVLGGFCQVVGSGRGSGSLFLFFHHNGVEVPVNLAPAGDFIFKGGVGGQQFSALIHGLVQRPSGEIVTGMGFGRHNHFGARIKEKLIRSHGDHTAAGGIVHEKLHLFICIRGSHIHRGGIPDRRNRQCSFIPYSTAVRLHKIIAFVQLYLEYGICPGFYRQRVFAGNGIAVRLRQQYLHRISVCSAAGCETDTGKQCRQSRQEENFFLHKNVS